MSYIEGASREEILLFPEAVDDLIGEENPVRFIDVWIDQLDFKSLGFGRTTPKETGRPGYDPRSMLKLYIYGYLNHIRSSRRLEKEAHRNCEVMWLLKKLVPDFKTISDFRKDNKSAIKKIFREFTVLCKKLELFSGELIAIDGSKFKAVNSRQKNFNGKKLKILLKAIDKKIGHYLKELDTKDVEESRIPNISKKDLDKRLQYLKQHKEEYQSYLKELEEGKKDQISLTDKDSRSMMAGKATDVCYNVQTSVDEKHKLIMDHEVTNDITDQHQLSIMSVRAKKILDVDKLEVVADMGYCNTKEFETCLENDITPYVPRPLTSANTSRGLYGKEDFVFDEANDCYICPAGEKLTFRFETTEKNRHIAYYVAHSCIECKLKPKCTKNKRVRRITRLVNEHILEETNQRARDNPQIMKKRKELSEHPFGTIKGWMRHRQFLTKGIKNVASEASLLFLSYNIKRVMNILSVKRMIEALA